MQNIMMNICIKYRPRVDADKDWMEFYMTNAQGCTAKPAR
jgi:hypothetical protein